tara:strand:+ start:5197 stop:6081 length:885 start_codon:yes stop_codon:yes gene_type:complete
MKLISFDIGIKNMAYCILDLSGQSFQIKDWNVLNLMDQQDIIKYTCTCKVKTKKEEKVCGKQAKYKKENMYYCTQHANSNKTYMTYQKDLTTQSLKKKKVDELITLGKRHMFFLDNNKRSKTELLNILDDYFSKNMLEPIVKEKKINAGDTNLITIGKNLKHELMKINELEHIDIVFIENQISPIANRMKTIQGMLAQYFIMTNENTNIEFVSSGHKLKQFEQIKDKNTYKENKQQSIFFSKKLVDSNEFFVDWKEWENSKKKDDLADCFLQGLFYFIREKNIYYADDLKIKIV